VVDEPDDGVGTDPLLELDVNGRVPLEVVLAGVSSVLVPP